MSTQELNPLEALQGWYHSRCDGEWEHGGGIEITTLDKPGWRVLIDLKGTPWDTRPFSPVERMGHETEWIQCRVQDGRFEGAGGPLMLEEIVRTFLIWTSAPEAE